jgi:hypothetical protein
VLLSRPSADSFANVLHKALIISKCSSSPCAAFCMHYTLLLVLRICFVRRQRPVLIGPSERIMTILYSVL